MRPYRSPDDPRLHVAMLFHFCNSFTSLLTNSQWLEHEFLQYLGDWEASAEAHTDLPLLERRKLCRETLEGLRITGLLTFVS